MAGVEGRAKVVRRRLSGDAAHDVGDRRPEAWIVRRECAALDQDDLGERTGSGEPARTEDLVGARGLADAPPDSSIVFWPTLAPATSVPITKISQPAIARRRCRALQCPIRAARLRGCRTLDRSTAVTSLRCVLSTSAEFHCRSRRSLGHAGVLPVRDHVRAGVWLAVPRGGSGPDDAVSRRPSRRAGRLAAAPRRCGTRAARGPRTDARGRHPEEELAGPGPTSDDDAGVLAVRLDRRVPSRDALAHLGCARLHPDLPGRPVGVLHELARSAA